MVVAPDGFADAKVALERMLSALPRLGIISRIGAGVDTEDRRPQSLALGQQHCP